MELYQLRQFQAAAKHKNMTRAAAELCIAQPALSKTIHKLEEEFGSQLFIRNKKGLECTRQGEILLHYADKILSLSDDASRAINNIQCLTYTHKHKHYRIISYRIWRISTVCNSYPKMLSCFKVNTVISYCPETYILNPLF